MKTIELLAIGIRLLGLYLGFQLLQFSSSFFYTYQQFQLVMPEQGPMPLLAVYTVCTVLCLVAIALFIQFPATVARWLLPKTNRESPTLSGDAQQLQLAGFTLLGITILARAIPDLIHNLALLSMMDYHYDNSRQLYDQVNLAVTVVELLMGGYLTLQAQGLLKLINKFRYASR
ncbi:hypothetical protein [Halioxenophilus sp. WMMB6]|uniref:hypothetical protein n=1 Tax=Halioxenophilus sp. WMMB6 TaxID=3073815 RepID=UPI00295ED902|nr:hypothetical protein [Halioxenophilus sp. WMMB6]